MSDEKKVSTELAGLITRKKEALEVRFTNEVSDVRAMFDKDPLSICVTESERVMKVFQDEGFFVWKNTPTDFGISVPSVLPWEVLNV